MCVCVWSWYWSCYGDLFLLPQSQCALIALNWEGKKLIHITQPLHFKVNICIKVRFQYSVAVDMRRVIVE